MDVALNLINMSQGTPEVVLYQENAASSAGEAVAWKVFGTQAYHPFVVPGSLQVAASGPFGNVTPMLSVVPGQRLRMEPSMSGNQLSLDGAGNAPGAVQVVNGLSTSSIDVQVFRDQCLLAVWTGLAPGQTAAFEFKPTIWVGVAAAVTQGQVMSAGLISAGCTAIPLQGIASADIMMTGGGSGANATPYQFTLRNVVPV